MLSPSPGTRMMLFNKSIVLLERSRRDLDSVFSDQQKSYRESFILRAFKESTIRALVAEGYRGYSTKKIPAAIRVCVPRANWWDTKLRPLKDPSSVIMDGETQESLFQNLHWFYGNKKWYADLGIDYHRGYILHGPPGSGKTSLVKAVATKFDKRLYCVDLSKWNSSLEDLVTSIPANSIVLMEDIDAVFEGRKNISDESKLAFNTLLNLIDGAASNEGLVFFFTTNHPERLDAALTRPGRCDMTIYMGNATPDMARRLFLRFFPGKDKLASRFGETVPEGTSMATLQEHLIGHVNNAEGASANLSVQNMLVSKEKQPEPLHVSAVVLE